MSPKSGIKRLKGITIVVILSWILLVSAPTALASQDPNSKPGVFTDPATGRLVDIVTSDPKGPKPPDPDSLPEKEMKNLPSPGNIDGVLEKQTEKAADELAQKIKEQAGIKYEDAKEIAGEHARQAFDFAKGFPVLLLAAAVLAGLLILKAVGLVFRAALAAAVVAAVIWYLSLL